MTRVKSLLMKTELNQVLTHLPYTPHPPLKAHILPLGLRRTRADLVLMYQVFTSGKKEKYFEFCHRSSLTNYLGRVSVRVIGHSRQPITLSIRWYSYGTSFLKKSQYQLENPFKKKFRHPSETYVLTFPLDPSRTNLEQYHHS